MPNGIFYWPALMNDAPEFSDVCRHYWGRPGELLATGFSVVVLVGGVIVYWVLMSNFLFYTGAVVYESLQPNSSEIVILINKSLTCDVSCVVENDGVMQSGANTLFAKFWGLRSTVPIYLALLAYPLLNFKSPTFFTKFNVFGTVSVFYLLAFVIIKATKCGFHIDMVNEDSVNYIAAFNWKFPSLTGTLALSYFIHNAILAILRNQKHPENNERDLALGYVLSAATYMFIGLAFYLTFPLDRAQCIADNFLNNFGTGDALSAVARLFLLFQMLCVLPLLLYIVRAQLSYVLTGSVYPGLKWVMALNAAIITICILFAIFVPTVGNIIRFTGSISGMVYIFTLPCLVHMKKLQDAGALTLTQIVVHMIIIALGVANLVAQFAIL